jgi:hypothetical protein
MILPFRSKKFIETFFIHMYIHFTSTFPEKGLHSDKSKLKLTVGSTEHPNWAYSSPL